MAKYKIKDKTVCVAVPSHQERVPLRTYCLRDPFPKDTEEQTNVPSLPLRFSVVIYLQARHLLLSVVTITGFHSVS